MPRENLTVTVLGAGIAGLWSAFHLCRYGFNVEVISKTGPLSTSSTVAASVLTPFLSCPPETPEFMQQKIWAQFSLEFLKKLDIFEEACDFIKCFEFGENDLLENSFHISKLNYLDFSTFTRHDLPIPILENDFSIEYNCYLCNPMIIIPWLVSEIKKYGGSFITKEINNIQDIQKLNSKHIFNCMGFQNIFPDDQQFPVFGQSMFVPSNNNDGNYFGIGAGDHGIFRHRRGFYIGSFFIKDDASYLPKNEIFLRSVDFLKHGYQELCESVGQSAQKINLDNIEWIRTGIRPFRHNGPRIQYEKFECFDVTHNYGHGAHGWTLSCATGELAVNTFLMKTKESLINRFTYKLPNGFCIKEIGYLNYTTINWCAELMKMTSPWSKLKYTKQQCAMALANTNLRLFCLYDKCKNCVGFMSTSDQGVSNEPMLEYLCITRDQRSQGLGSMLIDVFENKIYPQAANLYLFVSDINPRAITLYEGLGYKIIGKLQNYNLFSQTEYLMRRTRGPKQE